MLLWIDEHLLAFRRLRKFPPTLRGDRMSLFVYRIVGGAKLCIGDYDDGGFESYWIYPSLTRAIEVAFTWSGHGVARYGRSQATLTEEPGTVFRPVGDATKEYVKDLPQKC